MATLLLRKVISAVAPLRALGRCTAKPQPLSTLLWGSLRGAAPVGAKRRAEEPSLLWPGLLSRPQPALGFKTKGVIKKRCKDCYLVKRRGRWFVYCKTNPRHKQRQM
ncbi:39S ribosomal protein L36, mitochondrial [Carlito syrichta]|uniref:Ribosomal protein n=1 Tax=Carlito syrichta TaxID=1868482 RepID=A0A1U7SNB4_CARSF|nr:39S ribosomal protein L36, mitochondrial [Carlito syrichta]XP_008049365.1 39S ribosomal protein L36, mitochondrial [Carlito syrichta]